MIRSRDLKLSSGNGGDKKMTRVLSPHPPEIYEYLLEVLWFRFLLDRNQNRYHNHRYPILEKILVPGIDSITAGIEIRIKNF